MNSKKDSWIKNLFEYANGHKGKFVLSVLLSILSITAGLVPFFCMYKVIEAFVDNTVTKQVVFLWCAVALGAYFIKVVFLEHRQVYHTMLPIIFWQIFAFV